MCGSSFGPGNLLQNPGFESGLEFWYSNNVTLADTVPAEGTQVATMNGGVACLSQDVALDLRPSALLLSFIAYTLPNVEDPGPLFAEVQWLDGEKIVIGSGLRIRMNEGMITDRRITISDITTRSPGGARYARVLFSKGGSGDDQVALDQVLLVPVRSPNLLRNPGFEAGLSDWQAENFTSSYIAPLVNNGNALLTNADIGTLKQDISLSGQCPRSHYLLGFSLRSNLVALPVFSLIWLDWRGEELGRGIDEFISGGTLASQDNFLSYLTVSGPAPLGAVSARVLFSVVAVENAGFSIDEVFLVNMESGNLVKNAEFADGLDFWQADYAKVVEGESAYTESHFAQFSLIGGSLFQLVELPPLSSGHSFLFSFAIRFSKRNDITKPMAEVRWLDIFGRDLGLAASVIPSLSGNDPLLWEVFVVSTGPAPNGAVAARVLFNKEITVFGGNVDVDHVLLARLE